MPGTCDTMGRNSCTSSIADFRSLRGVSRIKMRPEFPPAAVDIKELTQGCFMTISFSAFWCCTMLSNEMPCTPSVNMKICPVSSSGRKPLGVIMNRYTVATNTTAETSMVVARYLSDHHEIGRAHV